MGANNGLGDDKPVHSVRISQGFWMSKTEVTQAQWERVMGNNPSRFKGSNNPVERVSWNKCQDFVNKLNNSISGGDFRLPTETEWEYACRSGTTGDYAGNLDSMAWYSRNSEGKTHSVGEKRSNAWGLHDMHGNVWEWCHDGKRSHRSITQNDPVGASGSSRVLRGGSWNFEAEYCRSASRLTRNPSFSEHHYGFRVVVSH